MTNIVDVRTNFGEERTEQGQDETRAENELQQGQINKTLVIHQTRKVYISFPTFKLNNCEKCSNVAGVT